MRATVLSIVVIMMLLLLPACATLSKDSEDAAFVHALGAAIAATDEIPAGNARQAMDALKAAWAPYKTTYWTTPPAKFKIDPVWGMTMQIVDMHITTADTELQANNTGKAHEQLEMALANWADIYKRNNVRPEGITLDLE